MLNSPGVLVGNKYKVIDEDNLDIKAIVENGRTLVPMRFISETFGAKVSFDPNKMEVKLEYQNKVALVKIGSKVIVIDGVKSQMDVAANIIQGRTLLPLRKLAEEILGKKVYFENDIISIGDNEEVIKEFKGKEATEAIKKIMNTKEKEGYYQLMKPEKGDFVATMETSMGNIKIRLFNEYAPKAVENFIKHSKAGYYNGLIFHRVIEDFMIQGGDPKGDGTGGNSIWNNPFEDEFNEKLLNIRGAVSMANSGPNTNGSQFFIVQNKQIKQGLLDEMEKIGFSQVRMDVYKKHGGTPWLDLKHTVFGQVYEGLDVVDKIAKVQTDAKNDKPIKDVIIIKISIQYL
jgi:peptidyl-prolyl cis-trans isomerase B (cyclophilin B)